MVEFNNYKLLDYSQKVLQLEVEMDWWTKG